MSRKVARGIWFFLGGLSAAESIGMFILAPYWNLGTVKGEINALACFAAGFAVGFFLLATSAPGAKVTTKLLRITFAACAGLAANIVLTWGLWVIGYPIVNGTVRRGLMESNYWLGPAALAFAVLVWLSYRKELAEESETE